MADAFNLARAGRLNYSIALSLTGYMRNEVDYIPWKSMETYSHFDDDPLRVYAQAIAFKLALFTSKSFFIIDSVCVFFFT